MKFIKLNWWRFPLIPFRAFFMVSGWIIQYIGTVTAFYGNKIPGLLRP